MAVCTYNVAELCAGGGGLGLGIKLAVRGARGVVYVEREAAAAALLVTRMEAGDLAPAPVWSDLATFDARRWRGRIHCVASGDPCQPNSNAGRRGGADDERFLIDQVLRVVNESRPLRLFRENVTGHADGQLAALVGPLEGMGYRVAAGIWSSACTANSHGRERLFVMADREDGEGGLYPRPWRSDDDASDAGRTSGGMDNASSIRGEAGRHGCRTCEARGRWAGAGRTGWTLGDAHCSRCAPAGDRSAFDAGRQPEPGCCPLAHADRDGSSAGNAEAAEWCGAEVTLHDCHDVAISTGEQLQGEQCGELRSCGWQEPDGCSAIRGRTGLPICAPGPSSLLWGGILDADPLLAPALGQIDLWRVARRRVGLPPLVDAIGRRGGMAWDLDADATAAVKREVRRMADAMAGRVERLRLLGNGVDPVVGCDAWIHLDALHRAARSAAAGQPVVRAA